jgi:mannose-6-phosphate isomerase
VQVHPSDRQPSHLPAGELGKTEAWVVLQAGPAGRVYAGLNSFTTKEALHRAVVEGTIADHLASFAPQPGDVVFVEAGTVHSLSDFVVFEVQENSDVTFRLYDWGLIAAHRIAGPTSLRVLWTPQKKSAAVTLGCGARRR